MIALWLAARDPRVPLAAKLVAATIAAYALSPIDLIPDFVPVLGYIDDLLIVPAGIWLAARLVPPALMDELGKSRRTTTTAFLRRVSDYCNDLDWCSPADVEAASTFLTLML